MMDAAQPGFEVGKYEMNDRHELFGNLRIAPFRDGYVVVAMLTEAGIAAPIIGDDPGAWRHGALDEAAERLGASVRNQGKSNTACIPPILPFVEAADPLALADFDGTSHEHHVVDAAPLAACTSAHPGFIGLDDFVGLAADPVLVGANHADPEFVENLEGGLVARQSELPLELDCRHARRLAGNQVGCREPDREWRVRALHDGAGGETSFTPTLPATKHTKAGGVTIRLAGRSAVGTDEAVSPSCAFKIGSARRFVWEQALKLQQRVRERQIISLKHVNRHDRPKLTQMFSILPVVVVCDNRISTVSFIGLQK